VSIAKRNRRDRALLDNNEPESVCDRHKLLVKLLSGELIPSRVDESAHPGTHNQGTTAHLTNDPSKRGKVYIPEIGSDLRGHPRSRRSVFVGDYAIP
jgi:hypothetical protein